VRALRAWGLRETVRKFYQMRQIKFGTLIGVDELGNKYYENMQDYPYGQHRWVEPARWTAPALSDASLVTPTWHGWLHYTTDKVPPSSRKVTAPEPGKEGVKILQKSDTPVKHHANVDHRLPWRPNPSVVREKGYKIDHYFGKAGENKFYVQPGHIASPVFRDAGPKIEAWDGTPSTVAGKQALPGTDEEKEPWEFFFEQRQKMNREQKG